MKFLNTPELFPSKYPNPKLVSLHQLSILPKIPWMSLIPYVSFFLIFPNFCNSHFFLAVLIRVTETLHWSFVTIICCLILFVPVCCRIWQCSDGHPLCENCRKKPEMNTCPTCRKYLVGRSTIAEKLARALYAPSNQQDQPGEDEERKSKKI